MIERRNKSHCSWGWNSFGPTQHSSLLVAQGELMGHGSIALADTACDYNVISGAFAVKLGISIGSESNEQRRFDLANGNHIYSKGEVALPWTFRNETVKYNLKFAVVPQCEIDIIIGGPTLISTGTLGKNNGRLRVQFPTSCSIWGINLLSTPRLLLRGTLNNQDVLAIPDTGSERNILSPECAKRLNLTVDFGKQSSVWLRFPDGTVNKSAGSVRGNWAFGNRMKTFAICWDILPGFPADALIGNDFLHRRKAFVRYSECLVTILGSGASFKLYGLMKNKVYKRQKEPQTEDFTKIRNESLRQKLNDVTEGYITPALAETMETSEDDNIRALPVTIKKNANIDNERRKAYCKKERETQRRWYDGDKEVYIPGARHLLGCYIGLDNHEVEDLEAQDVEAHIEILRRKEVKLELDRQLQANSLIRQHMVEERDVAAERLAEKMTSEENIAAIKKKWLPAPDKTAISEERRKAEEEFAKQCQADREAAQQQEAAEKPTSPAVHKDDKQKDGKQKDGKKNKSSKSGAKMASSRRRDSSKKK